MVNWAMIGSMILPNTGGWAGALAMGGQVKNSDGQAWYQTIKKPSWNPPNWVFGPAWTALYTGMGYASYMVYRECGGFTARAVVPLSLYGGQLVLNWMWTPIFFKFHQIGLACVHIVTLDVAAAACAAAFYRTFPTAGLLMAPYLAWLAFATALNYSIWDLNKDKITDGKEKL
ncbi:translocator protein-like [Plutella xylostella]|uniref:translocator protein-like n=1 Tax=Plutella xylostella TaxID=51655 RepID=UPI002032C9E0|nr:translocator protein-like [Plutella xylostella]XP_048486642.1 translocator protein-like [Plutella xylostella]XP_048486643.1 translocator protein-like [Plutella xylostella]